MSVDDVLLEACRLAPAEDAPRLVWADAVGGDRGELVVIQCDLARGGLAPAEAAARRRRERELLAAHGAEWSGLADFRSRSGGRGFAFRRGFVEAIELEASAFAEHGEEIFRRAPLLRSLAATGLTVTPSQGGASSDDPLDRLRALLESPACSRLHGLHLLDVGTTTPIDYDPMFFGLGDQAARLLAESGALAHLGGLGISSSGLTAAGVHHLVASGELEHFDQLWLRDTLRILGGRALGGDAVLAVLAHAPRVRLLDLGGATEQEAFVPALPPVIELRLSWITDEVLAALGRSRAAPTVETLGLSGQLSRGDGFRAFPRLRVLDLGNMTWLGDPDRRAHEIAAALPSVRRLRLGAAAPSALRFIARALGPQLEELELGPEADLGDGREVHGRIDELQAHVAGEVRAGGRVFDAPPLAEWQ